MFKSSPRRIPTKNIYGELLICRALSDLSLEVFLRETENVVRSFSAESDILRKFKPLLGRLLENQSSPLAGFKSRKDKFATNLVYMPKDEVFSVNGVVWLPGQTTPIHDHLTWALVGLYDGEERESIYRRTDDGLNPKVAQVQKVSEKINKKGHITVLGKAGIHRIDNISDKSSMSMHVYGIDIGNTERHTYDPVTREIGTFVSGYCNVLRDTDWF